MAGPELPEVDSPTFSPDDYQPLSLGQYAILGSMAVLNTMRTVVTHKFGSMPPLVEKVWSAENAGFTVAAVLASDEADLDIEKALAVTAGALIGQALAKTPGGFIGALIAEYISNIPPTAAESVTMYAAEGYWGLEFASEIQPGSTGVNDGFSAIAELFGGIFGSSGAQLESNGQVSLGGGGADSGKSAGSTPGGSTTVQISKNDDGYVKTISTTTYEPGVKSTTTKQTVSTPDGPKQVTKTTTKPAPAPPDDPKKIGPQPILLDLDGTGVQITELSRSPIFMDGGEGLLHRTAWAGAGDGVLFFDPDGRNSITEQRQYVFTEWDPTAKDDLAAIRSVFDTNGDGKLTAADADFAKFKVLVTNADGTTTVKTWRSSPSPRST